MADKRSPADYGLRSSSFSGGSNGLRPRVIASVEALEKRGKTDWCLRDTPGPIVVFNFDQGLEGVIDKFEKKKEIIVAGMPLQPGQAGHRSYHFMRPVPIKESEQGIGRKSDEYMTRVQKEAVPIWERFISDYAEFLKSKARTGVIDTGGAAYQLGKFAIVGTDKAGQREDPYNKKTGELNSIFQGLITDAYNYDKNLLWIHRLTEAWEDNRPSGKYRPKGYRDIDFEVQVVVRVNKSDKGEFSSRIRVCRMNPKLEGETFEGKEMGFSYVMATVFGSDQDEWR